MKLLPALFAGLLTGTALTTLTGQAEAGNRPFTYVYEATTSPKGMIEYEQWVTWKARRGDPGTMNQFEFRHEIEFGVTDRLQIGLYLSNWKYVTGGGTSEALWDSVSVEAIYNLTSPTKDWLGSAVYGEITVGDRVVEVEGKLILQKDIGNWTFAYNAELKAEWEGSGLRDDKGEFEQAFGVSYQINPSWSVGGELLHEVEFDHWRTTGDHAVYLGPNVSYRWKRGFVTTTVLFQATGIKDEADVQTRLIFGINF